MSSLKQASKVSQAGELWEERQLPDIGQEEEWQRPCLLLLLLLPPLARQIWM